MGGGLKAVLEASYGGGATEGPAINTASVFVAFTEAAQLRAAVSAASDCDALRLQDGAENADIGRWRSRCCSASVSGIDKNREPLTH